MRTQPKDNQKTMSRMVGLSKKLKKQTNAVKSISLNSGDKNKEKKNLSKIFSDIDLSEYKLDLDNFTNTSFKCASTSFHSSKSNLNNDQNSLINNNNDNDGNDVEMEKNDTGLKESVPQTDCISYDDKTRNKNKEKKKLSAIFSDIDLSEYKLDLDNFTNSSFKCVSTSFQASKLKFNDNQNSLIVNDNDGNDVSGRKSSLETIRAESQNCEAKSIFGDCDLSDIHNNSDNHSKANFPAKIGSAKDYVQNNKSHAQFDSNQVGDKNFDEALAMDPDDDDLLLSCMDLMSKASNDFEDDDECIDFMLRTDYCLYGDEKIHDDNYFYNNNDNNLGDDKIEGFKKCSGELVKINENSMVKARELFKDIENMVFKEILEVRKDFSFNGPKMRSTPIESENCLTPTHSKKEKLENNEESSVEVQSTSWGKSKNFLDSSNSGFQPIKSVQNNCKSSLPSVVFDDSDRNSLHPFTSTPDGCSKKRTRFEPLSYGSFAKKLKEMNE